MWWFLDKHKEAVVGVLMAVGIINLILAILVSIGYLEL